jgi:hypothetical protein
MWWVLSSFAGLYPVTVPNVQTEFGKRAFMYSAQSSWNTLQNIFKLEELVPIGVFKSLMKD